MFSSNRGSATASGKTTGGCPGYRKDHIKALGCGGPDAAWNMQWQTVADARAKDRWERKFAVDSFHNAARYMDAYP